MEERNNTEAREQDLSQDDLEQIAPSALRASGGLKSMSVGDLINVIGGGPLAAEHECFKSNGGAPEKGQHD